MMNNNLIKALIIEDDLSFSKRILNSILSKFKNIQLSYIATTYKEGISILSNNQIDLIFLDINLPDGNGINILEDLKYMNTIKKPQIIVISGDTDLPRQVYNIKYKGTLYIIEAIMYVYNRNNFDFVDNLEQNVYKYISYKHQKIINNIKTNIIKATNEREKEKMLLYKLTPKASIITILNKVRNQYL